MIMKFIDEVDIELVNQELNFHSPDNNLIIKGGCDLFTTKAIGSDRKLFKTIDKHLDQIMEDNQLSQSMERERKQSVNSFFGSSASPQSHYIRRGSLNSDLADRERRMSAHSPLTRSEDSLNVVGGESSFSQRYSSALEENNDEEAIEESPFGPLKDISTRKTFAYLIAILNTTYPDHDFSNLQPSTENFHKIDTSEELVHRFNSVMVSLGKKEDLLSWIWDTINVYMNLIPPRSPTQTMSNGTESRKGSLSNALRSSSPLQVDSPVMLDSNCKIYEFQPSDSSILEDMNYPYQTLWSNYWFIYNKKKKRVCFLYLTAINRGHHSLVNRTTTPPAGAEERYSESRGPRSGYDDDFEDDDDGDDQDMDEDGDDVIGDMEI